MKKINIYPSASLNSAIKKLSKFGSRTLCVIDKNNRFLGTLSDGDIRKALLKTKSLNNKVEKFYNKNSTFFFENSISKNELKNKFYKDKFDLIPILKKNKKISKIISLDDFIKGKKIIKKNKKLNLDVVIMAGGYGLRLKPFTSILPKPLIPINNKPVIKHILDNFINSKLKKFWITINYKSILMKAYFKELNMIQKINFLEEIKPLGTVGSLALISKKLSKNFFLSNCDTIIKANYNDIYDFHKKNNFDLTIVASLKKYVIPYGVCEVDNENLLKKINEKPNYNILINTGLYVIKKNNILKYIPKNKKFDFDELVELLKQNKKRIGVYPISNNAWIDVGQWSEYKNALDKFK